jgi:excisionase family DNA binding protein
VPDEGESVYLTVAEAARLLGFPIRTITRWVNEGRLPYVVIEGEKCLARDDVRAIFEGPADCDEG